MVILRLYEIVFWDKYMDTAWEAPASGKKWTPATGTAYEQKHDQEQKEIQQENWINEGEAFDLISVLRNSHILQTIKHHKMSKSFSAVTHLLFFLHPTQLPCV